MKKRKELVIRGIHLRIFRFFSDANISPHAGKNQSLAELLHFCMRNGGFASQIPEESLRLGRRRYYSLQAEQFSEMVQVISTAVLRVRTYHQRKSGRKDSPPGFIYVAHDIWDGKRKCILGVSIFMADPTSGVNVQLPVGFVTSKGKSAQIIAQQTLQLLDRYGIIQSDLLKPINDTTNSALAAGRLIIGGGVDGLSESGGATCTKVHLQLTTQVVS